jgi:type IV secretory pathway VirD2 relaxase
MGADDFTPRLGRPGNRGQGAGKRYAARVKRAVKRMAKPKGKAGFTGERSGRGTARARYLQMRRSPFSKFRMRRVIVKVHIARASKGIGKAAFRAHLKYIQRDGVSISEHGRNGPENDKTGGELYGSDGEKPQDKDFLVRSEDDRHQFRVILSPEDADQLGDLKENTRAFMGQVEKDLGTRLDWVAVDHYNTGHPHSHIVIRGRDERGGDLVIARDYLTKGMRARAQEIIMDRLGPRRDMEIARAYASEVTKERLTGIDRRLSEITRDGVIEITPNAKGVRGVHERFEHTLQVRRLTHLESLGLVEKHSGAHWRMTPGWEDRLKELGKRGDIIRSINAATGREVGARNVAIFDASDRRQKPVLGRVAASGPEDELRDTRFLVIEGVEGKDWHVALGATPPGSLPPSGAIIEASPVEAKPKQADRTIAAIAEIKDGLYSEALHAADDPSASKPYIEAHKRRLEALRRAGFVLRQSDGVWRVGKDYLEKAADYETSRLGAAKIDVKSWVGVAAQTHHRGATWLDDVDDARLAREGFGADVKAARMRRAVFLKREGLWSDKAGALDSAKRKSLAVGEKRAVAAIEAQRTGKTFRALAQGGSFAGVYERPVNLVQGRFALVTRSKEFTLVPWRPELERHRGRSLVIKRTGKGIEWTLGKTRGLGR